MVCFLKFSNNSKPLIILTPGTVSGGSIKRFPKNKFKDFLGGPRRILYSYPSALFFISTIMPVVNATTTPATRSSFCSRNANKTFSVGDEGFEARCSMERSEWTFVTPRSYSALTEFGLVCDRTWLSALVGSSYHIGGFLGISTNSPLKTTSKNISFSHVIYLRLLFMLLINTITFSSTTAGSLLSGVVADLYGRKPVVLGCLCGVVVFSSSCYFIQNVWQLICINVLLGAVFIVVFFFVVCWKPWIVVSFMMAIKEQLVDDVGIVYRGKALRIVQSCCLMLGFMSSAVNVFVYTFKNKALRKEWLKFMCSTMVKRRQSSRHVCQDYCMNDLVQLTTPGLKAEVLSTRFF